MSISEENANRCRWLARFDQSGAIGQWLESKKVKDLDLSFLSAVKSPNDQQIFVPLAVQILQLQPSFSEGLQLLELLSELVLLGHTDAEIKLTEIKTLDGAREILSKLRYPQTALRDQELKKTLLELPWPYGAKLKFERRGDRAGVELKLFVSSKADLTKILASLQRVQSELK